MVTGKTASPVSCGGGCLGGLPLSYHSQVVEKGSKNGDNSNSILGQNSQKFLCAAGRIFKKINIDRDSVVDRGADSSRGRGVIF